MVATVEPVVAAAAFVQDQLVAVAAENRAVEAQMAVQVQFVAVAMLLVAARVVAAVAQSKVVRAQVQLVADNQGSAAGTDSPLETAAQGA